MKISPIAQSSGGNANHIGSIETSRTASPMKLQRAQAIARGEVVPEEQIAEQTRVDAPKNTIKMHTQRSVYRDQAPQVPVQETPQQVEQAEPQSSIPESVDQAAVEATQPLSPQFAALAKQKRALQLERAQLEKDKAALATQPPKMGQEELIARLKSQPVSTLQELELLNPEFYNAMTEHLMSDEATLKFQPEIQALKAEIKALKEGVDKTFVTQEQRAEESALTEMLYEAEALAKEGEAFEMIREQNQYESVLRLIHDTYKKTGRVLNVQDAMNTIEDRLLQQAEKLARLPKIQSRLTPLQPQPQGQPQRQMRTLTSRDNAAPVLDRRTRAIMAANNVPVRR